MDEILVVCTANICRSPMAEALLRSWIDHHAPTVADRVRISSAGVRARPDDEAAPHMARIATRWGMDLGPHRSRPAAPEVVDQATLVLTMELAHRDVIAQRVRGAASSTFTLPELAELLDHVDPAAIAGAGIAGLAEAAHRTRPRVAVARHDVEDPYGGPADEYETTASELVELVERVGPAIASALRDQPRDGAQG